MKNAFAFTLALTSQSTYIAFTTTYTKSHIFQHSSINISATITFSHISYICVHIFNYLADWCGAATQWPPHLVTITSLLRHRLYIHNFACNRRHSYMELAPRSRLMANDTAFVIFARMSSRAQQLINLIYNQHRKREKAGWALARWCCSNYQKFLKPSLPLSLFSAFPRCGAQHAINHFKYHPSTCLNKHFVIAGDFGRRPLMALSCCLKLAPLRLSEFVVCEMRYVHLRGCFWRNVKEIYWNELQIKLINFVNKYICHDRLAVTEELSTILTNDGFIWERGRYSQTRLSASL